MTYEPETVYEEETGTRSTLQTVTGVFMIASLVLPILIMIGIVLLLAAAESMGVDYTYYMMVFVVLLFYDDLLYQPTEQKDAHEFVIASYVVDPCGCVYCLYPTAVNHMDYEIIRKRG